MKKLYGQIIKLIIENLAGVPAASLKLVKGFIFYRTDAGQDKPYISDGVEFREIVQRSRLSDDGTHTAEPILPDEGGTGKRYTSGVGTQLDGTAGQILEVNAGRTGYDFVDKPSPNGTWDATIGAPSATYSDINAANALATAGDGIRHLTETRPVPLAPANQTITKEICIVGQGEGSIINGDLIFATGSDGARVSNVKVLGDIIINVGVEDVQILNFTIPNGNVVTDNGTGTLYLGVEEET